MGFGERELRGLLLWDGSVVKGKDKDAGRSLGCRSPRWPTGGARRPKLEAAFPGCRMMDGETVGQSERQGSGMGSQTGDGWYQSTKADLMVTGEGRGSSDPAGLDGAGGPGEQGHSKACGLVSPVLSARRPPPC